MLASRQTRNSYIITSKKTYALTAAGTTPTSPTSTYNYGYSSGWGDKLISYRGVSIDYDAVGNPLSYYNGSSYSFSWTGRQLTGATKGGITYSFTYNDEGIRTSKTKGNVTTTYYLDGSRIVAEETNGNVTVYLYDSEGLPIGMQYRAESYANDVWDAYWYERNLQGDVVAVYNSAGTKLISYTYDAWGNTTVTYHNGGASTTAIKNPFRYRGYYYDVDLGLYYLNTRYYDANTGRFINADSALYHSILGYNMYAYCKNNPVNFVDHSGESAEAVATFFGSLWAAALAEPTPAGEIVAGVITVVGAIGTGVAIGLGIVEVGELIDEASQSNKKEEVLVASPQSITQQNTDDSIAAPSKSEIKTNNDYDPNPYGRPGEKKQNRENRNKSRTKDGWKPRNNKRDGKPAKPKSHTPSKKGHKKYFSLNSPIYFFDF